MQENTFRRPSNEQTIDKMIELLQRCDPSLLDVNPEFNQVENIEIETIDADVSVKNQMQKAIEETVNLKKIPISESSVDRNDVKRLIQIEMMLFDNNGNRGKYLTKVYNYLMTIVPTSVEAERAFSSAGILCTKIRSSLSDKSLNALCFLRSYFKSKGVLLLNDLSKTTDFIFL